jgi:hypothetical protein
MKFLRSIGLAALLMVGASSASAQVYYDMVQMSGQSGYRSEIYETVTTADFLRAPANGVQRLAFTKGSAFAATVYACETKTYAAGTCTSVATLSATNTSILVTTGRAWLIVDVTAAETAGNVSYLTIRSHSTQQLSGGGAQEVFNVSDYGVVADGVTDDSTAFNAASADISAAGGGILYIPKGTYCLGENGQGRVYSGLRVTSSNVSVLGDGPGQTVLRPCGDNGNYAVTFCAYATSGTCAARKTIAVAPTKQNPVQIQTTTAHFLETGDKVYINGNSMVEINDRYFTVGSVSTDKIFTLDGEDGTGHTTGNVAGASYSKVELLTDISIENLTIEDLDTFGDSGHANYSSIEQTNLSGGVPARYDSVTWDGGGSSGTVLGYDAASGRINIYIVGGSLSAGDVVTDSTWSATAVSVEGPTVEESHAIACKFCKRFNVTNIVADRIADESFDIFQSQDVLITDSYGLGCGREDGGGSCISISGSKRVSVIGGSYEGGTDSVGKSGAIIAISTNTETEIEGISITGTQFYDYGTGADLIEAAVSVNANQANISGVVVTGARIALDADDLTAIALTGSLASEANIVNTRISGRVNAVTNGNLFLTNTVITNTTQDSGSCVGGIKAMIGGSASCSAALAPYTISLTKEGSLLRGVDIFGDDSCVSTNTIGATIVGNKFRCGDGGGLDFVIREVSGADETLVANNYYQAFSAGPSQAANRVGTREITRMTQTNLATGTPAAGDSVTWNSGAEDGTVVSYDVATGDIVILVASGTAADELEISDVVTNGTWTATAVKVYKLSDGSGEGANSYIDPFTNMGDLNPAS